MSEPQSHDFVKLLDYLKASRAFDFSGYKISSLMRRVQKRMREVQVSSYAEYIDYLEVHPQEFGPLFDTVLINVTSFFRDAAAWPVSGRAHRAADPEDAEYPAMPRSAIDNVAVDRVVPLDAIPGILVELAGRPLEPLASEMQHNSTMKEDLEQGDDRETGEGVSGFTCPDCGGALWESREGGVVHFRCRTGHAFSPQSLIAGQSQTLEAALWAAVRSLEENVSLNHRMERWTRRHAG